MTLHNTNIYLALIDTTLVLDTFFFMKLPVTSLRNLYVIDLSISHTK